MNCSPYQTDNFYLYIDAIYNKSCTNFSQITRHGTRLNVIQRYHHNTVATERKPMPLKQHEHSLYNRCSYLIKNVVSILNITAIKQTLYIINVLIRFLLFHKQIVFVFIRQKYKFLSRTQSLILKKIKIKTCGMG